MKIIKSKSFRADVEAADAPQKTPGQAKDHDATQRGLGRLDAIDVYKVLAHGLDDPRFLRKFSQLSRGAAAVACDFAAHVQQTGLEQRRKIARSVALREPNASTAAVGPYTAGQQAVAGHFIADLEILGLHRELQRLWSAGLWEEALVLFDRVEVELRASPVDVKFNLGKLAEEICQFGIASGYFADVPLSLQHTLKMRQYVFAAVHTRHGVQAINHQRIDIARHHLHQALQARPNSLGALSALATASMHQRDFPEAIALLQKAVSHRPDFHWAHSQLGDVLIKAGRPKEGLVHLKKSAERFAKSSEHHMKMGGAFHTLKDFRAALQCYEQAAVLNSRSFTAKMGIIDALYELKSFVELVETCSSIMSDSANLSPTILHHTMLRCGQGLFEQARFTEAEVIVQQLIGLNRFNQNRAWAVLGQIKLAEGGREEAKAAFRRAVSLEDGNTVAHVGLGKIEYAAGDLDGACDHYEAAIRSGSDTPETYLGYARGLHELGSYTSAKAHYHLAIGQGLTGADGLAGLALIRSDEGQHAEAVVLFRAALEVDANSVDAHAGLGEALFKMHSQEEAVASLTRAITLDDTCWRAHSTLAHLLVGRTQYADATVSLRKVVASRPHNARHWKRLSEVLAKQGFLDEAIDHLQTALSKKPEMVAARAELGDLYLQHGRLHLAAQAYWSANTGTVGPRRWERLREAYKQQQQELALGMRPGAAASRFY